MKVLKAGVASILIGALSLSSGPANSALTLKSASILNQPGLYINGAPQGSIAVSSVFGPGTEYLGDKRVATLLSSLSTLTPQAILNYVEQDTAFSAAAQ